MVAFAQATEARKLKLRLERESSSRARSVGNLGDSFGGGRSAFRGGSSGCRMRGHIHRECRASRQGIGRGTTQSSSPTTAISSAPPPARGPPAPTGIEAEQLHESFSVSTLIGEYIMAAQ
uniref:Serine/arginine-rich splicing factor RSZ22-like n=1 Tax=Nicotiana tabacum TaxID=4097 RepID=A0A1S4C272_TOBAC